MNLHLTRTLLIFAAIASATCGRETVRGQIVVGLTSNMPIPKSVTDLSVSVFQEGVLKFNQLIALGPSRQPLPTGFTLVRGKDAGDQVIVKLAAWQGKKLRLVREAITTIPSSRVAYLPVELQWFCDGQVKPYERETVNSNVVDPEKINSSCAAGETCVNGDCVDAKVDSDTLADYDPALLYGNNPDVKPECFDVATCFANPSQVFVDPATCTIDVPQGGKGINVAIETEGEGFCTSANRCFIPLDAESIFGWTTVAGGRLKLNPAACKTGDPRIKGCINMPGEPCVSVSVGCSSKTVAIPTCPDPR